MDRMNKALLADSGAIFAGSLLGTSSTTAYIESASGVQAGGRTGLTAVTVAVLFLACLTIAPLAGAVPAYATAPALFFVSCLMLRELTLTELQRYRGPFLSGPFESIPPRMRLSVPRPMKCAASPPP